MDNFLKPERIYTILELNTAVRGLIKSEFSEYIWVCGEIQDFRASRDRRHVYFNFVQKHPEADQIMAKISAAIFQSRRPQVLKRLKEADSNFELKDDIEVKFLCEVDLYPKTGNFSLIVVDIDPIYTLGKIAQSRQRIIEDLRRRGLLDKNKLKDIPVVPLRIGLITAHNSAAYHDFTNEIKISGYSFEVLAYNCHMQGKFAEKDVIGALSSFNNLSPDELDVVVITRGGGSTADLSYFDNEKIAEAVALSRFPVISALGHQINTTITDMAAHTFCKTPTKAAQFLVNGIRIFMDNLNDIGNEIRKRSKELLEDRTRDLQSWAVKIDSSLVRYFRFHREELLEKKHNIISIIKIRVVQEKEVIGNILDSLSLSLIKLFSRLFDNLKYLEGKVNILNPKNTLKRGYSITLKAGKALKAIDDLEKGDEIKTIFYKGSVMSKVTRKE